MKTNYSNWLKRVQNTQQVEIDCTTCLDQISHYVDLELSGGDAAGELPQVSQHLNQCTVCHEEYLVIRDLARLENDNDLPTNEDLAARLKRKPE